MTSWKIEKKKNNNKLIRNNSSARSVNQLDTELLRCQSGEEKKLRSQLTYNFYSRFESQTLAIEEGRDKFPHSSHS